MTKPACHYLFIARTALRNKESGKIEFKVDEKRFEDKSPIYARESAFAYRNQFLRGMLTEGIGKNEKEIGWNDAEKKIERLSEREIRKLVNPYLEPEEDTDNKEEKENKWKAPTDTLDWYPSFKNGIWIVMKHNDAELHEECKGDDDIVIDKVSRYEEPLPTPPNYLNLKEEYAFYKKHKYEMKSYLTSIVFFDDEAFLEGGEDEDEALITVEYLRTPFDWSGYDKIYWWEAGPSRNNSKKEASIFNGTTLTLTMEEAWQEKEHHSCEFKPGLINRLDSNRNMEHEIAKSICAFLNAHGGYLFIGVGDNGEAIGLDFNISKDFFLREFTRIKARYLPPFIAHTIYGNFYSVDGKNIFAVTVNPSLYEPIFLRQKDENNKLVKEFYVRSDASSRHIYDIEEIVKYCKSHWGY